MMQDATILGKVPEVKPFNSYSASSDTINERCLGILSELSMRLKISEFQQKHCDTTRMAMKASYHLHSHDFGYLRFWRMNNQHFSRSTDSLDFDSLPNLCVRL